VVIGGDIDGPLRARALNSATASKALRFDPRTPLRDLCVEGGLRISLHRFKVREREVVYWIGRRGPSMSATATEPCKVELAHVLRPPVVLQGFTSLAYESLGAT
jgi:hypothetical protein